MVQDSPRESLFNDRFFVSGMDDGIAKRFKDPAQVALLYLLESDITILCLFLVRLREG